MKIDVCPGDDVQTFYLERVGRSNFIHTNLTGPDVELIMNLGSIHNLPRWWAMMILRGAGGGGVTLFPYNDLVGAVENFQRKLHRA